MGWLRLVSRSAGCQNTTGSEAYRTEEPQERSDPSFKDRVNDHTEGTHDQVHRQGKSQAEQHSGTKVSGSTPQCGQRIDCQDDCSDQPKGEPEEIPYPEFPRISETDPLVAELILRQHPAQYQQHDSREYESSRWHILGAGSHVSAHASDLRDQLLERCIPVRRLLAGN